MYCDLDWAGDINNQKSTTGYVIMLNGTVVGWKSTKQSGVSVSMVGAEYYTLATMIMEVL